MLQCAVRGRGRTVTSLHSTEKTDAQAVLDALTVAVIALVGLLLSLGLTGAH